MKIRFVAYLSLTLLSAVTLPAFTAATIRAAEPEAGQPIFEQKCQVCHTIGGGRTIGPDLKDVSGRRDKDWLVSFITSPGTLIAQGDPIATRLVQEYGTEMPDMAVTQQEAENILAYIEAQSGAEPSLTEEEPARTEGQTTATPVLVNAGGGGGRDIFTGKVALQNGGAACISCHNVDGIAALGGGSMGKDLTTAYSTFGKAGLTSMLKAVPFPVMKEAYSKKPLTDDEVTRLIAFLQETGTAQQEASSPSPWGFIVIGIAGFLVSAGILQLIWRGRLSGVRQLLVKGGSR